MGITDQKGTAAGYSAAREGRNKVVGLRSWSREGLKGSGEGWEENYSCGLPSLLGYLFARHARPTASVRRELSSAARKQVRKNGGDKERGQTKRTETGRKEEGKGSKEMEKSRKVGKKRKLIAIRI
ncbi:hypothetical protein E2C01_045995 [Portunus trituberculatus]|uniref:Uncharacterized protein n=1 Tax=Portunus trituberculatus TaxID=210409 RepID=A0A5B7G6F5_PORTR|nr:hypothetical protein [Portunus trituberculatus]